VLRSHQSRFEAALELTSAAMRLGGAPSAVGAFFHAHMFAGHAEAMRGRPAEALAIFRRLAAEAERRQVERYLDGRPINFIGWVLRNLGDLAAADEHTNAALEASRSAGFEETCVAAELDLAWSSLLRGDTDAASRLVNEAEATLQGGARVFGWRHGLKAIDHRARIALAMDDAPEAKRLAVLLAEEAEHLQVPRYAVPARLLAARAGALVGEPADLESVEADLVELDDAVPLEAWWVTAEVAHDLGIERWWQMAQKRADRLARQTGDYEERFRRHATERLEALRV